MKNRVSCHKAAFRCFQKTFFSSLVLCMSQAALWLAFIYVAFFSLHQLGITALSFLLPCLLLLLIYRLFVVHRLALRLQPNMPPCKPFLRLIPAALWRLFTGMLWLFPFGVMAYRFYQYIFVLPATTFTSDFARIGAFLASTAALNTQLLIGTAVFFSLLILTFVIFLYGWRSGNCFDLAQTEDLTFYESLRKAQAMRKATRKSRLINTITHALLLLPAIAIPLLLPMIQLAPLLTGKAMNDIQLIYAYLSAGIVSSGTLLTSSGIFLALYLPWLPFRKLHNIAVVVIRHE